MQQRALKIPGVTAKTWHRERNNKNEKRKKRVVMEKLRESNFPTHLSVEKVNLQSQITAFSAPGG